MDAAELARWTRFAGKGGIGKGTAVQDCVAKNPEDLMFLKDDEIVVLMQIKDQKDVFLGYCEGVVGRFDGSYVRMHGKLKTPVMTKRSSSSRASSSLSVSQRHTSTSQSPVPSLADAISLRAMVSSPNPPRSPAFSTSSIPSIADSNATIGTVHGHRLHPGASYSSSSSAQESASPQTPNYYNQSFTSDESPKHPGMQREVPLRDDSMDLPSPSSSQYSDRDQRPVTPPSSTQSPGIVASPTSTGLSTPPAASAPMPSPYSPPRDGTQDLAAPLSSSVNGLSAISPARTDFSNTSSGGAFDDSTDARMSVASDGVMGIGLSLLQNFANGGDGDDASFMSRSETSTPEPEERAESPSMESQSHESTVGGHDNYTTKYTTPQELAPIPSHTEPEPESAEPELEPSQEAVAPSPPPEANERRNSLQPSLNPSEASSFDPEDWEGASDIYDDYRYSRMSMASKMSRFSRMSKVSVFTGGGGGSGGRERDGSVSAAGLPYPPPVPPTFERSYSADSFRSGQPNFLPKPGMESPLSEGARRHTQAAPSQDSGRPSFVSTSTRDEPEIQQDQDEDETPRALNIETAIQANVRQSDASQYSIQSPITPSEPSPSAEAPDAHDDSESVQFARARPAPLEFATSPLLHATFGGSPGFSPAMHTGYTGSTGSEVASPPYSATSFEDREAQGQGNLGGAASALRQKIEIERNANSPVPPSEAAGKAPQDQERRETREIVIDDDEQSQDEEEEGEDETVISPQAGPSRANSTSTSSHSHHGQLNVPPANTYPSEKKRAPLIVVNPAPPPPPYSPSLVPTSPDPESTPPVTPMTPATPISPMPEPQHQQSPLPSPQVQSFSRPPSAPSTPQDGSFPQSRQSLFMPHPNAPKPTPGPMAFGPTYGRKQLIPPHMLQQMQLQNAAAPFVVPGIPGGPMGPGAGGPGPIGSPGNGPNLMNTSSQTMRVAQAHRARTVYGLTQGELGTSMGPVPIVFSLEPLNNIPALRLGLARRGTGTGDGAAPGVGGSLAQPVPTDGGRRSGEDSRPNGEREEGGMKASESGNVIPRANFFPKTSGARPRSRSFSGFDSTVAESTIPQESPDGSIKIPAAQERTVRTSLPSQRPPVIPSASTARQSTGNHRINAPREHRPSPLAMAQPIVSASSVPSSPATAVPPRALNGRPSISSLHSPSSGPGNSNLRKSVSTSALVQGQTSPSSPLPSVPAQPPWAHRPRDDSIGESISSRVSSASQYSRDAPPLNIPASKPSLDSSASQSSPKSSRRRQGSIDTVASQYTNGDARSSPTPGSGPVARNTSLRSKLSLGHLRSRPSLQTSRDESMTSESLHETIQVEDMDFELVKPNIHREHGRASEDSVVSHSPNTSTGPGLGARKKSSEAPTSDLAAFLRSTSPGGSNYKPGGMPPSPHSPGDPMSNPNLLSEPAHPSKASANKTGVEAHRNRELKWINAISSTPSSQARKSKKFKKLVYEGVPGSVRYQVWAHLADSKAKRIEGLYAQLGKRGDVAAKDLIVADAKSCFANARGRLGEPDGPVVSLLQAYLTMVPDIQYHRGLTVIAGQLLMHAPEEDAFWIFISMMDTHLRSYFAANAIQMDVDASLFVKAVESADPSVAKKLFTDMSISPVMVCRPWFASLFAESLPTEYFERVWDIFLCEGVPYLFRVGLALITCCRRRLLDCNSEEAVLQVLHHPPPILLSSTADILVELANSVKLKDDDVRKQRTKMEAQIKRQAQQQQTRGLLANSGGGPAISLPR